MKSNSNKEPREQKESPKKNKLSSFFNQFSAKATKITGGVYAFVVAIIVLIIWAVTGPVFKFSDTWQLVINTSTSVVTFLMVFIIQHSQNKDTIALQLKLDELIAASTASNKLICVEDLTDEKLDEIKKFYAGLSEDTKKEKDNKIHSLEESNTGIENMIDETENK